MSATSQRSAPTAGADPARWIPGVLCCARPWGRADIRRVELAYAGFNVAEYGVWVSVLVYAYERGGTGAAALLAVAQLLPAAALAPILARGIDRHGPGPALWHGYLAQAITLCATAGLLLAGGPPGAVWPAAICASVALTVTRPAQATLVPLLASSRAELTAVNVLSCWVESVSVLTGAGLAGGLIAVGGPGAAVAAFAVGSVLASAVTAPLARLPLRGDVAPGKAASDTRPALDLAYPRAGLGPLLGLLAAQYLVIGVLDVAMVALAIGMLGLGASGAGYLNAALGAGGLLGSLIAVTLIAHRRLTPTLVGASLGWGIVVALLGVWPTPLGAFALVAGAGCGRSLLDVSGRTLLMRHSLPSDRARLFGALEGVSMLALAAGSALVPLLAIIGGLRGALIVVGGLLSLGALLTARNLQRLEERHEQPTPTSWVVPLTTSRSVPELAVMIQPIRPRRADEADQFFDVHRANTRSLIMDTTGHILWQSRRIAGDGGGRAGRQPRYRITVSWRAGLLECFWRRPSD